MVAKCNAEAWDDLPGDIWNIILDRLTTVVKVYSVACAAHDLASLAQVTGTLHEPRSRE